MQDPGRSGWRSGWAPLRNTRQLWKRFAVGGLAWVSLASAGFPAAAQEAAAVASPPPSFLERIDRELSEIDSLLESAHFRTALGLVKSTRASLEAHAGDPRAAVPRARLEVMAATAEVAFGRTRDARRSLVRALQAHPSLVLDERTSSPKLVALMPAARRQSGLAGGGP